MSETIMKKRDTADGKNLSGVDLNKDDMTQEDDFLTCRN